VIDALDELGESEEDALQFMEIISSLGPHVKILCTSRFSTTFEEYFSQATKLQISAQNDDIAKFLEAQISQKYRLSRHVRADPKLKDDIVETIIKKSQGMWVTLPVFPFAFMGANWAGFYYQNFISNRSRTRSTVKRYGQL